MSAFLTRFRMLEWGARIAAWLPVGLALLFPVFFIPACYDAYVLPRAALALAGAGGAVALRVWLPANSAGRLGALALPGLAVAGAALISLALSINPPVAVIGSYGRYESAPIRLAYLGLFAASAWGLRSARHRWWFGTAFLAGTAVAGSEALFEAATHSLARPDGNLGQANLLGALLAMAIPLALLRALRSPRWAVLLLPLTGGLIVSTSRSGWLGALAGCALLVPLLARRIEVRRGGLVAAVTVPLLALTGIVTSPLARLNSDVGTQRPHVWWDALHLVAARPLFGWGEESFGLVFGRFVTGDWEPGNVFDRAHQFAIDIAAAQGLAGLAAGGWFWTLWLVLVVRRCWSATEPREEVPGLIAAWAGYLVTVSVNFDWAPATAPVWLLAGAAWSSLSDPGRLPAWIPRPGLRTAARAGLALATSVATAALVAFLAVLPVLADLAYAGGDTARAVSLDPLQAEYHRALGARLLAGGRDGDAAHELAAAARLGESSSGAFVDLGDAYRGAGDRSAAAAAYREAVRLNPYDGAARQRLAELT